MKINIKQLSTLSHVGIPESKQGALQESVESVLSYVEQLTTAAVADVHAHRDPMTGDELRTDEPRSFSTESRTIILNNFPNRLGDLLQVPPVL